LALEETAPKVLLIRVSDAKTGTRAGIDNDLAAIARGAEIKSGI